MASLGPRGGWDPHPHPPLRRQSIPSIPGDPSVVAGWQHGISQLVMLLWQPAVISLLVMPRQSGTRRETHLWRPRRAGGGRCPSATPVGSARCQDVFLRRLCIPRGPLPTFTPLLTAIYPPKIALELSQPKAACCLYHPQWAPEPAGGQVNILCPGWKEPLVSRSVRSHRVTPPGLGTKHLPGVQLGTWHQRNDYLPELLSLQAVHSSSHTFRGSWCLDGAAEAATSAQSHTSCPTTTPFPGQHSCRNECANTCKASGSQPYSVLPCNSAEPSSKPSFLLQQVALEEISKVYARLLSWDISSTTNLWTFESKNPT